MQFRDRIDAGAQLAKKLLVYAGEDTVVVALPRGGVVLGVVIAHELGASLDLAIVRKIGHPVSPEYAIGAVTDRGETLFNEEERQRVSPEWLSGVIARERTEARRRRETYLKGRERASIEGKTVIVVDDGVATGMTLLLAIRELKTQKPKRLIVAVPVVPRDTAARIREVADELVALDEPLHYRGAVGAYYDDFTQVTDEEVVLLLEKSRQRVQKA